jgi:hypothetical protein
VLKASFEIQKNAISFFIEQRKNEFERIAKVRFSPIYFYALRGWNHFPNTCQDLFLAERMISQVLKISYKSGVNHMQAKLQLCINNQWCPDTIDVEYCKRLLNVFLRGGKLGSGHHCCLLLYLTQQNVDVLPWPAVSPDLSPIEHV